MRKREALYGEFIGECARLLVDAFIHTLDQPDKLLPIYALLNRIRLCGSPGVLAEAEHLLRSITRLVDCGATRFSSRHLIPHNPDEMPTLC